MAGLIAQLQSEALDPKVAVSDLLRKMKLAAAKLDMDSVAHWVEQEMSGYTEEPPEYRVFHGHANGWNQYHGWVPIMGDSEFMNMISTIKLREPLSSIESIIKKDKGTLVVPLSVEQITMINKYLNYPVPAINVPISQSFLVSIVDKVRTLALDWSIDLERAGITGEGLSFSPQEKTKAQEAPMAITIGSIGNLAGNIGSGNSSGDISMSVVDIDKVNELDANIRSRIGEFAKEGADTEKILKCLDDLKASTSSQSSPAEVKSRLSTLRAILQGSASGFLSAGALAFIKAHFGIP